jgi:hypothetical protein
MLILTVCGPGGSIVASRKTGTVRDVLTVEWERTCGQWEEGLDGDQTETKGTGEGEKSTLVGAMNNELVCERSEEIIYYLTA